MGGGKSLLLCSGGSSGAGGKRYTLTWNRRTRRIMYDAEEQIYLFCSGVCMHVETAKIRALVITIDYLSWENECKFSALIARST